MAVRWIVWMVNLNDVLNSFLIALLHVLASPANVFVPAYRSESVKSRWAQHIKVAQALDTT